MLGEELGTVTPQTRFAQTHNVPDDRLRLQILSGFVAELLTGTIDQFSSVGMDLKVSYPLCYVCEILKELLPNSKPVRALLRILIKLESASEQVGTGMDWEASVQLAVILRCMSSHYRGTSAPFDIVPDGVHPVLEFLRLPQGCTSLPLSRDFINSAVRRCKVPTLLYIEATESSFEAIDGLVIYSNGKKWHNALCEKRASRPRQGTIRKCFRSTPNKTLTTCICLGAAWMQLIHDLPRRKSAGPTGPLLRLQSSSAHPF